MAGRTRMSNIRITAAAAVAVVFAFTQVPAFAASCDDGDAGCSPRRVAQQEAPMKLDNFMQAGKAASSSRTTKRAKTPRQPREALAKQAPKPAAAPEETAPPPTVAAVIPAAAPAPPERDVTDGVAVTSFNEVNQLDAATPPSLPDGVQLVTSNDVNEVDLAAPPPAPPAETVAQAAAP